MLKAERLKLIGCFNTVTDILTIIAIPTLDREDLSAPPQSPPFPLSSYGKGQYTERQASKKPFWKLNPR
jgi:hypothetical protein